MSAVNYHILVRIGLYHPQTFVSLFSPINVTLSCDTIVQDFFAKTLLLGINLQDLI